MVAGGRWQKAWGKQEGWWCGRREGGGGQAGRQAHTRGTHGVFSSRDNVGKHTWWGSSGSRHKVGGMVLPNGNKMWVRFSHHVHRQGTKGM